MNSDDRERKRAMIRIEIRSYGDVDPRSREVCGSTSWEVSLKTKTERSQKNLFLILLS